MSPEPILAVLQALTLLALLWYAWETRLLRVNSVEQMRMSVMPVLQVVFHRAPPRIFLKNKGAGIATDARLQSFRYRDDQGRWWRCLFEPSQMILPGQDFRLDFELFIEPLSPTSERLSDPRTIFDIALKSALSERQGEPLSLSLYSKDLLGNCYESTVVVDWGEFTLFLQEGNHHQPRTLSPKRISSFPETGEAII